MLEPEITFKWPRAFTTHMINLALWTRFELAFSWLKAKAISPVIGPQDIQSIGGGKVLPIKVPNG